jgi:hypothetical protein
VIASVGKEQEEYDIGEGDSVEDLWKLILERHIGKMEAAGYVNPQTGEPNIFNPGAKQPNSLIFSFQRKGLPGMQMLWWHDGLKTALKEGDTVIIGPPRGYGG